MLLLAPTGKARVQLETKVEASREDLWRRYLTRRKRYDGETGRYLVWGDPQPRRSYSLVVIDEASMLTEEMLAATLDAFTGVKRLILVGDPRQLPPIGAGRPFVDLVNKLRPETSPAGCGSRPATSSFKCHGGSCRTAATEQRHDLELAAWFGDNTRGAGDDSHLGDLADEHPTSRPFATCHGATEPPSRH